MNPVVEAGLALSQDTSAFAHRLLNGHGLSTDLESVIEAGHCLRILRFVEAVELLVHAGLVEPACALTRTVLEAGWVLIAIRADPKKFDAWLSDANHAGRNSIRRLKTLQLDERGEGMSDAEIDAAISTIPAGEKHTVKDWAAAAGTPQAYVTIYQTLSTFSHAEMQAAAAYVEWGDDAQPKSIREPKLDFEVADCLNICAAMVHDLCRAMHGLSLSDSDQAELAALEMRRSEQTRQIENLRAAGN